MGRRLIEENERLKIAINYGNVPQPFPPPLQTPTTGYSHQVQQPPASQTMVPTAPPTGQPGTPQATHTGQPTPQQVPPIGQAATTHAPFTHKYPATQPPAPPPGETAPPQSLTTTQLGKPTESFKPSPTTVKEVADASYSQTPTPKQEPTTPASVIHDKADDSTTTSHKTDKAASGLMNLQETPPTAEIDVPRRQPTILEQKAINKLGVTTEEFFNLFNEKERKDVLKQCLMDVAKETTSGGNTGGQSSQAKQQHTEKTQDEKDSTTKQLSPRRKKPARQSKGTTTKKLQLQLLNQRNKIQRLPRLVRQKKRATSKNINRGVGYDTTSAKTPPEDDF